MIVTESGGACPPASALRDFAPPSHAKGYKKCTSRRWTGDLMRAARARRPGPKRGAGYAVYGPWGQKISRAEEGFVNRDGEPMYGRVRIGFFGTRTVLIPVQFVETDDQANGGGDQPNDFSELCRL